MRIKNQNTPKLHTMIRTTLHQNQILFRAVYNHTNKLI